MPDPEPPSSDNDRKPYRIDHDLIRETVEHARQSGGDLRATDAENADHANAAAINTTAPALPSRNALDPAAKATLWIAAIFVLGVIIVGSNSGSNSTTSTTETESPVASATATPTSVDNSLARLTPEEQQNAAFAAAFSSKDRARFSPVALIDVGTHKAVIASNRPTEDAAHADPGTLAVRYVDWVGGRFTPTNTPAVRAQAGSFGRIADWKLRRDLQENPVILLEGGGTWQGCTNIETTIIELSRERPSILASHLPTAYEVEDENGHRVSYEGNISNSNSGFKIQYTGDVDLDIYLHRAGNKLIPDRELPPTC